ncbi:MAG: tol-pal system protein YbgF [Alphaproteobacteria bacterium]|nr:tol-pal system protein YbgF [Alphaproteobacteria bacterium]OJV45653.1 MAG: tol-pal system protein YbgF [Alphaproteobacteria bacterium 43-37]
MRLGFITLAAVAGVCFSSTGYAETDTQKIERLERQLNLLSQQIYKGGAPVADVPDNTPMASPASNDLMPAPAQVVQPVSLEQQQQQLLGRFEELEHEVNLLKQKVDDLAAFMANKTQAKEPVAEAEVPADVNLKAKPEKGGDSKAGAKTGDVAARDKAQTDSKAVLPEGSIQEQYDHALATLKAGQFKEASKALHAFLKNHGDHELAANATYWLGETYFAQQNYEKAVVIFAQGYKAFSKGTKGPDMLLKIAMCLEQQKKPKDACVTVEQLFSNHASMAEGTKQAAQKAKQRLKCG